MMGAGKSTVGRLLGADLGRGFVDTDEEIVRHVGRPIAQIFEEAGEPYFRAVEHQVVREVARADDLVVALGGGAVLSDDNVAEILLAGVIVELRVSVAELVRRLAPTRASRPLLAGGDLEARVAATVAERAGRYAAVADLAVEGGEPPDAVVDAIVATLMARGDVLTPGEHELQLPP